MNWLELQLQSPNNSTEQKILLTNTIAQRRPKQCEHPVSFDPIAAMGMTSDEVKERFPRWSGKCPKCGYQGVLYASREHMLAGDW